MNREIKFRMWNNVEGKPERSRYFYDEYDVFECLKQQALFNKNPKDKLGYDHVGDGNSFEQFTGLKDKNGTEIYEGDIVYSEIHKPNKMEVKFIEGGFCMDWGDVNYPIDINHFFSSVGCCIEVIGNIYETEKQKTGF